MYPSVHVRLPSDFRAARAARQSMKSLEPYVPPETLQDVNLLVSELVTNSVKHASLRQDEAIEIDANPINHGLRVEVTNPGHAELANTIGTRSAESGWGLLLVTKIASRWGVSTNDSTHIWFEIDLANV